MQKTPMILAFLMVFVLATPSSAQQIADTLFNPEIVRPAYVKAQGPKVLIDEAHNNFHTANGRFKPFARLLEKDGYVVSGSPQPFTPESLASGRIVVIANALHADNREKWTLPTPSAFTDAEIEALNTWVKNGGALLLIADHMPFPGAAEKLAASFGFRFLNGFAIKSKPGKDIFKPGKGLMTNALTNGRSDAEKITSLQTFTGQAFEIPQNATPVIVLSSAYRIKLPKTAWQFKKDTQILPGENLVQGAYLTYGAGRVVVFGEAAMFTAQTQGGKSKMGMNAPSASQNAQFLLNTIHWLDKIIE